MLAIPVFRSRVAPVLDWCTKIVLVQEGAYGPESIRQVETTGENSFKMIQALHERGIRTIICGALSPEVLNYGKRLGMSIIHGVAGDIGDVLRAFHEGTLDQPRYWLPGCRGKFRCKNSSKISRSGSRNEVGKCPRRGQKEDQ